VAAGSFLVKQAGGKVTDFSGGADYVFGGTLVSSNSLVHQEMLEVIKEYFN
jgi:myo-inositol-1(or 4)-monophosphatase